MYVLTRADGHTVGNHTYHHPDMSRISDKASFQKEMDDVAALFKEVTGGELAMYYRPPQGKYSKENLQMAKETGTRMPSPATRRLSRSLPGASIPGRLYCCTAPRRQTGRSWMSC